MNITRAELDKWAGRLGLDVERSGPTGGAAKYDFTDGEGRVGYAIGIQGAAAWLRGYEAGLGGLALRRTVAKVPREKRAEFVGRLENYLDSLYEDVMAQG